MTESSVQDTNAVSTSLRGDAPTLGMWAGLDSPSTPDPSGTGLD